MDQQLQSELNDVFKRLQRLDKDVIKAAKTDLNTVANKVAAVAKSNTPQSKSPHVLRGGKLVKPGNLKKAVRRIALRRAKYSAVVGIKLGGAIDGFYGRFVEQGTKFQAPQRFLEKTRQSEGAKAQRDAISLISKRVNDFKLKYFNR